MADAILMIVAGWMVGHAIVRCLTKVALAALIVLSIGNARAEWDGVPPAEDSIIEDRRNDPTAPVVLSFPDDQWKSLEPSEPSVPTRMPFVLPKRIEGIKPVPVKTETVRGRGVADPVFKRWEKVWTLPVR